MNNLKPFVGSTEDAVAIGRGRVPDRIDRVGEARSIKFSDTRCAAEYTEVLGRVIAAMVSNRSCKHRKYVGKDVSQLAKQWGRSPDSTASVGEARELVYVKPECELHYTVVQGFVVAARQVHLRRGGCIEQ